MISEAPSVHGAAALHSARTEIMGGPDKRGHDGSVGWLRAPRARSGP